MGVLIIVQIWLPLPEALVAEAGVPRHLGELAGQPLHVLRLHLRDVERRVEHAELHAAVVAHVRAAPLGVDVVRRRLLGNNHRQLLVVVLGGGGGRVRGVDQVGGSRAGDGLARRRRGGGHGRRVVRR